MYHFAVAVEDANLTTGPWSEVVDILWDGKYSMPTVVFSVLIHTSSSSDGCKYLFSDQNGQS